MNEQIRALAVKADLYVDLNSQPWPRNMSAEECEAAYKKFAELIVQECISTVQGMSPGYHDYRNQIEDAFRRDCVIEIKNKFGVEHV